MFITGNLPGPLFAGQPAAFFLPDRNITITRFSMYVNVPFLCSPAGTVSIVNSGNNTDLKDLNITGPCNDLSGLSIPYHCWNTDLCFCDDGSQLWNPACHS